MALVEECCGEACFTIGALYAFDRSLQASISMCPSQTPPRHNIHDTIQPVDQDTHVQHIYHLTQASLAMPLLRNYEWPLEVYEPVRPPTPRPPLPNAPPLIVDSSKYNLLPRPSKLLIAQDKLPIAKYKNHLEPPPVPKLPPLRPDSPQDRYGFVGFVLKAPRTMRLGNMPPPPRPCLPKPNIPPKEKTVKPVRQAKTAKQVPAVVYAAPLPVAQGLVKDKSYTLRQQKRHERFVKLRQKTGKKGEGEKVVDAALGGWTRNEYGDFGGVEEVVRGARRWCAT